MTPTGARSLLRWLQSWRWRACLWLDRPAAALCALDVWLADAPGSAHHLQLPTASVLHAWATRAHVLAGMGQWALAEGQLQAVLAFQPQSAAHWFNLGFVRLRVGRPESAQSAFERALALSPSLDAAWFGLGQALAEQGCWLRAEQAWTRQVSLQPWCPDGLEQLVRLHQRCGEPSRAAQRLAELRAFSPRRAMALEPLLREVAAP